MLTLLVTHNFIYICKLLTSCVTKVVCECLQIPCKCEKRESTGDVSLVFNSGFFSDKVTIRTSNIIMG